MFYSFSFICAAILWEFLLFSSVGAHLILTENSSFLFVLDIHTGREKIIKNKASLWVRLWLEIPACMD